MKTYRFTAVLKNVDTMTKDIAEALYEAGCDDGSPGSSDGSAHVAFDRESTTLESAVTSAVRQIRAAGFDVSHVQPTWQFSADCVRRSESIDSRDPSLATEPQSDNAFPFSLFLFSFFFFLFSFFFSIYVLPNMWLLSGSAAGEGFFANVVSLSRIITMTLTSQLSTS